MLAKHIVGMTSDGASTIVYVGKRIEPVHLICLAHTLHLTVLDIIYKQKTNKKQAEPADYHQESDSDESDDDDDRDLEETGNGSLVMVTEEGTNDIPTLPSKLRHVIKIVRGVVRSFRTSTVKSDALMKYVKDEGITKEEEMRLIIDTKTRWSSLFAMLERFLRLKIPIQKAMLDLKMGEVFSQDHWRIISDVTTVLSPFKAGVDGLCREDASPLTAVAIIDFIFEKLHESSSELSQQLESTLRSRVTDRGSGNSLFQLAYFLHTGEQNEEFNWLPKLSTKEIEDLTYDLYNHVLPLPKRWEEIEEVEYTPLGVLRQIVAFGGDVFPSLKVALQICLTLPEFGREDFSWEELELVANVCKKSAHKAGFAEGLREGQHMQQEKCRQKLCQALGDGSRAVHELLPASLKPAIDERRGYTLPELGMILGLYANDSENNYTITIAHSTNAMRLADSENYESGK
ncbi:hypothetical protein DMENIID0001_069730 [Sergentomyia squamirostris]